MEPMGWIVAGAFVVMAIVVVAVLLGGASGEGSASGGQARREAAFTGRGLGRKTASGLNFDVVIAYENNNGEASQRRVTVHELYGKRKEYVDYLRGWCHLRKEERTFKRRHIGHLLDPDTGEVIESWQGIQTWLTDKAGLTKPYRAAESVISRKLTGDIRIVWEREPGDLETFDVALSAAATIGAQLQVLSFEGMARRHKSATDRAWSGQKLFDLKDVRSAQEGADGAPIGDLGAWLQARLQARRRSPGQPPVS